MSCPDFFEKVEEVMPTNHRKMLFPPPDDETVGFEFHDEAGMIAWFTENRNKLSKLGLHTKAIGLTFLVFPKSPSSVLDGAASR